MGPELVLEIDDKDFYKDVFQQMTTISNRGIWDALTTEQTDIISLVNFSILSGLIGLFGMVTNVMNMVVFSKQGLNSASNICFFALALSDFLCIVALEWYDICLNPYLETDWVPFVAKDMQYLTTAWYTICFGRVTSWITAFITAERCLGVALPLKVKQIVTVKRTAATMIVIFVLNLLTPIPEYCIAFYDWKFVPKRNKTLYGLLFRNSKSEAYGLSFILTSISGMLSFVAVIVLTFFLAIKLVQNSKERLRTALNKDNSETRSIRDKKTLKLVVMIAGILIICYIPAVVTSLTAAFEPEFMLDRRYMNPFLTCWSVSAVCNTINASVNTLLYYNMSTNYRQTFNELFFTPRNDKNQTSGQI